jgi:hypothetical protein
MDQQPEAVAVLEAAIQQAQAKARQHLAGAKAGTQPAQPPAVTFIPAGKFEGRKPGYYFSRGVRGLGYAQIVVNSSCMEHNPHDDCTHSRMHCRGACRPTDGPRFLERRYYYDPKQPFVDADEAAGGVASTRLHAREDRALVTSTEPAHHGPMQHCIAPAYRRRGGCFSGSRGAGTRRGGAPGP